MPRSLVRLSASASSHRNLSSAEFVTNIAESDLRYTHPPAAHLTASSTSLVGLDLIREIGSGNERD